MKNPRNKVLLSKTKWFAKYIVNQIQLESLIMAQNERWRQA
jgi:hypothetical protein